MIKDFDVYRKLNKLADGLTEWEKRYDDGQSARLLLDDRKITRKKVIEAFEEQEYEQEENKDNQWI